MFVVLFRAINMSVALTRSSRLKSTKSLISAGLKIRYPLKGKVDRKIVRSFVNSDGLNIRDDYNYEDTLYSVPEVTTGLRYKGKGIKFAGLRGDLVLGAEMSYKKWSDYKFIFFGEEEARDIKDTFCISIGSEYGIRMRKIDLYLRLGFGLDSQPVKNPDTILKQYSAGLGLGYKGFRSGIGFLYVHGSTAGYPQDHLVVCTTLSKIL